MLTDRLDRSCAASSRRPALAAGAVVLVLLGALPLFGTFLYGMDLMLTEMGTSCALRRGLAPGGSWLLAGNGSPLFARPETQAFYPLRWLLLALPLDWAVTLMPVVHLAVAAAATTWLARTFRVGPFTAAAVGIAFAFSGPALNLIHHANYVLGAAFLPLAWAGTRRSLRPRGGRWPLLAAGLALVCCLLGGEPQSFAIGAGLIVLEVILRRPWARRQARRPAALLLSCIAASALVGVAGWLPTFEEMLLTPRTGALLARDALKWSFAPAAWPSLVIPGANSLVQPFTTLWMLLSGDQGNTTLVWNIDAYLGPLLLLAAGLGALRRRAAAATVVFAAGMIFAVGDALPVLPLLLKLVPPLAIFRYPAKYLVVASLAACVLAGVGLQAAMRARRRHRAFLAAGSAVALAVLLALGTVVLESTRLDAFAARSPAQVRESLQTLSQLLRGGLVQALVPLAGCLLIAAFAPRLRRVLPAFLALDLVFAAPAVVQVGPPPSDTTSALLKIPATASRATFCTDHRLDRDTYFEDGSSVWAGKIRFLRTWGFAELQECDGLVTGVPYTPLRTRLQFLLDDGVKAGSGVAAWALGCTHVVSPAAWPGLEPVPVDHPLGGDAVVMALPAPVARTFIVGAPVLLPSEAELMARVKAAHEAADVASLLDDPLGRLPAPLPMPSGDGARIERVDWPVQHHATLVLAGSGGAVIGLKTSYQAGWSARQEGKSLPLLRSMGVHLAVVVADVAAGPIELTYSPPHLARGIAVGCVGLLAMAALVALARRRAG